MPGTFTSIPNSGLPVAIAGVSTPRCGRPISVKSLGSSSVTVFKSGGGTDAARAASLPKPSFRPLRTWVTALASAVTRRNVLRSSASELMLSAGVGARGHAPRPRGGGQLGGAQDALVDAQVGRAAAQVAVHRAGDVGVVRARRPRQERRGR